MNHSLSDFEFSTPNKQIPLVNLDTFGTRPEPVVPDGVWIEIQGTESANEAVINAINEEKRIYTSQSLKQKKLKQFQKDVKKRVTDASKPHKQYMADSQSVKMEKERELLLKSASAAELSTPKKNRCSFNVNSFAVIDGTGRLSTSLNLSCQDQGDPMLHISDDVCDVYHGSDVRKKLAQKTIVPKAVKSPEKDAGGFQPDTLPGGFWGVGSSRDICPARIYNNIDLAKPNKEELSPSKDAFETVSATSASDDVTIASLQESIASSLAASQKRLNKINKLCNQLHDESGENIQPKAETVPLKANVHFQLSDDQSKDDESPPVLITAEHDKTNQPPELVIRSLPRNAKGLDQRRIDTSHRRVGSNKRNRQADAAILGTSDWLRKDSLSHAPPLINPGAFAHTLKVASERAKWLSRRVFADAERERSREQARWKEHQHRVAKLREEKERERAVVEEKSREQVEAVERANVQMKLEVEKKELKEIRKKEKMVKKQQKTDRFVAALYSQLRNRISQHKIELPPLCMCGTTFWDTNPSTCATNCIFHRNPKAYAKALEAVLLAVERNMGSAHKDLLQKSTVSLGLVNEEDEENVDPSTERTLSARSSEMSSCSDLAHRLSNLSNETW